MKKYVYIRGKVYPLNSIKEEEIVLAKMKVANLRWVQVLTAKEVERLLKKGATNESKIM